MSTQTANPISEIADPSGDYELTVRLSIDLQDYSAGVGSGAATHRYADFLLECGREGDAWRLRCSQPLGEDALGVEETGELLDLRDQSLGGHPLALLRALLSGGSA